MSDCLFCKIIHGEIPTTKVYEDDQCLAFLDIAPLAPTHFLVVPKQHFASAAEATEENAAVIGHIYAVIAKIAKEQGFADGYRVVTSIEAITPPTFAVTSSSSALAVSLASASFFFSIVSFAACMSR